MNNKLKDLAKLKAELIDYERMHEFGTVTDVELLDKKIEVALAEGLCGIGMPQEED